MGVHTLSEPESCADFLLTLPRGRNQRDKERRVGWWNRLGRMYGQDHMKSVEAVLLKRKDNPKANGPKPVQDIINPVAHTRNTDPDTSHDAARRIEEHLGPLHEACLAGVTALGTATQYEVSRWIRMARPELVKNVDTFINTCSPRFTYLVDHGYIEKTGEKRERRAIYRGKDHDHVSI
jgi:hypothetical protein